MPNDLRDLEAAVDLPAGLSGTSKCQQDQDSEDESAAHFRDRSAVTLEEPWTIV